MQRRISESKAGPAGSKNEYTNASNWDKPLTEWKAESEGEGVACMGDIQISLSQGLAAALGAPLDPAAC